MPHGLDPASTRIGVPHVDHVALVVKALAHEHTGIDLLLQLLAQIADRPGVAR
jgi:hypothetical protein